MRPNRLPRWSFAGIAVLIGGPLLVSPPRAEEPAPRRILEVSDLGLSRSDVPVSSETRVVYLVNPALNREADLQAMLAAAPVPGGQFQSRPFEESEVRALTASGRPGNTAAYDAVADVAEHFFKFMFTQVSQTDRTLHRLVQEVKRVDFPLAVFDAAPRLLARENGGQRHLETRVTIRV